LKKWGVWVLLVGIAGILFSGCTLFWEKGTLVRCPKCSTAFIIDDIPDQIQTRP
jgi:hypothetical protein